MTPTKVQTRRGDWMQTYSGKQFWPLDPDPDAIDIVDIAHALSNACRYAGHVRRFYSVAEHSVLVATNVGAANRKWALLHDASEAYLVDVPLLPGYYEAESAVMAAVCARFGLPADMPEEVKDIDTRILVDERRQLMAPCAVDWNLTGPAVGVICEGWAPSSAEQAFLAMFHSLFGEG